MIYEHLFRRAEQRRVSAGLIGTGVYGSLLLLQSRRIPRLDIPAVCDRNVDAARAALLAAGHPRQDVEICDSPAKAVNALERGKRVVTGEAAVLLSLPLEVIVESTGTAESGARHAEMAIAHGKHVAMVTKETDAVIGPILHHMAERAGVTYSPVDGDQHGLLIGLVLWARSLGLEVVCAGKAHMDDFVYDPQAHTVTDGRRMVRLTAAQADTLAVIEDGATAERAVEKRRALLHALPRLSVADLCESVIAANAAGLRPDVPALHGPILRIPEIPRVLCPEQLGGMLNQRPAVDAVICLRQSHEGGLAGGVFIVFACDSPAAAGTLASKGVLMNRQGTCGLIYRPYHLLGIETPITVLCAAILNLPTGGTDIRPRCDLVARTARPLSAGSILAEAHGAVDRWAQPLILPAIRPAPAAPLPLYMAAGRRLTVDAAAGTLVTADMIEPPEDSRLWSLRREQERMFDPNDPPAHPVTD
jgi:predicted homoserine dehydrogenase-like protein